MSSRRDRLRHALSFRLAVWYGVLFVASALMLVAITYALLAQSLKARDHELIESMLDRYAGEYAAGGLSALNHAISADRLQGRHEHLFVRVLARGSEAVFFNIPSDGNRFHIADLPDRHGADASWWQSLPSSRGAAVLEVASTRLPDGTLVQVGKSSESRDVLLEHFRSRVARDHRRPRGDALSSAPRIDAMSVWMRTSWRAVRRGPRFGSACCATGKSAN